MILDGTRFWNAAVFLDMKPAELAIRFDLITVSLTRALGCPVGSMLVGTAN